MKQTIVIKSSSKLGEKYQKEALEFLKLSLQEIVFYDVYDIYDAQKEDMDFLIKKLFSHVEQENIFLELPSLEKTSFRYRQVWGQYNEREDMVCEMVKLYHRELHLLHSRIVEIRDISDADFCIFKEYFLNPVENREIPMEGKEESYPLSSEEDLKEIPNFIHYTKEDLEKLKEHFSMDYEDLLFVQRYFLQEGRNPNMTELKVIDTYWSDHCRHTTFHTELKEIAVKEGRYKEVMENALKDYLSTKNSLEKSNKPVTLMDLATINAKLEKSKGNLEDLDESDEVNACAVNVTVNHDGKMEEWILYFKNETHNHPTEIEPFGGAATCIGGGIRDPLSGRAYVYQGMRLTGSKDPRISYQEKREGKRASRQICQVAAEGFADYAQQIGLAAGVVKEFYHDGFEAKRMELGALVACAPKQNVIRKEPVPGDYILLLGAKTGNDGIGAAVGSSSVQSKESLVNAGAEVQKGNPLIQRKIVRLFRNPKATVLIKRCNDFGAGGVSVAIGELAAGLEINLDEVPLKYPGMHGGQIALSESQERMAVVVAKEDCAEFLTYVEEEDVPYAVVAKVTELPRMKMQWRGKTIVDLSREFLNSNGVFKEAKVEMESPRTSYFEEVREASLGEMLSDINHASQKPLMEHFNFTAGANNVLYPMGGFRQCTPQLGMAARIPQLHGHSSSVSVMTYGYDPHLCSWSPFHGGFYHTLDAITKAVLLGVDRKKIRLSMQEYFEKLGKDPIRWGKPTASLLGAYAVMKEFELPAIGGKDSMSGSFEEIDVPPSLVAFAVGMTEEDQVISRELKAENHALYLAEIKRGPDDLVDLCQVKELLDCITKKRKEGKIYSVSTVNRKGAIMDLFEMAFGNEVGFAISQEYVNKVKTPMAYGILLEAEVCEELDTYGIKIGKTTNKKISLGKEELDWKEYLDIWESPLKEIYGSSGIESTPCKKGNDSEQICKARRVLLPIFPGTNGEYDMISYLESLGAEVCSFVIPTERKDQFLQACSKFAKELKNYDSLVFCEGALMGNEPDIEGKMLELFLQMPEVKDGVELFIQQGGKILSTGASSKAIFRSGLMEWEKINGKSEIIIEDNPYHEFYSKVLNAEICSDGQEYSTVISTRYGIVNVPREKEKLIISQFKNFFPGKQGADCLMSEGAKVMAFVSVPESIRSNGFVNLDSRISPLMKWIVK